MPQTTPEARAAEALRLIAECAERLQEIADAQARAAAGDADTQLSDWLDETASNVRHAAHEAGLDMAVYEAAKREEARDGYLSQLTVRQAAAEIGAGRVW